MAYSLENSFSGSKPVAFADLVMVGSALVVGTGTSGECCDKVSAGTGSAGECCDKFSAGSEVSDEVSLGMMDGVAIVLGNGTAGCNGISDMGKAMVS